jgi:hypothetical protein
MGSPPASLSGLWWAGALLVPAPPLARKRQPARCHPAVESVGWQSARLPTLPLHWAVSRRHPGTSAQLPSRRSVASAPALVGMSPAGEAWGVAPWASPGWVWALAAGVLELCWVELEVGKQSLSWQTPLRAQRRVGVRAGQREAWVAARLVSPWWQCCPEVACAQLAVAFQNAATVCPAEKGHLQWCCCGPETPEGETHARPSRRRRSSGHCEQPVSWPAHSAARRRSHP